MEKRRTVTHIGNFPTSKGGGGGKESQHSGKHNGPRTRAGRKVGAGMAVGKECWPGYSQGGLVGESPARRMRGMGRGAGTQRGGAYPGLGLPQHLPSHADRAAVSFSANPITWRQGCCHPCRDALRKMSVRSTLSRIFLLPDTQKNPSARW